MQEIRRAKAFLSCSLRPEDNYFKNIIIEIADNYGFDAVGTVGLYTAASMPIPEQMKLEISKADCVIIIATKRYFQSDIHLKNSSHSISEMIHTEAGMAYALNMPLLVFVEKGTDIGNFLPKAVSYIEIDSENLQEDLISKGEIITSYFADAVKQINTRIERNSQNELRSDVGFGLGIIGFFSVLNYFFGEKPIIRRTRKKVYRKSVYKY